ncbi:MAG: hypothetical protein JWR37_2761 [Mycobacterium sp.]|jgi:hypothetical protein|nr:hypothetical protein [Mycobacterium sp.]
MDGLRTQQFQHGQGRHLPSPRLSQRSCAHEPKGLGRRNGEQGYPECPEFKSIGLPA